MKKMPGRAIIQARWRRPGPPAPTPPPPPPAAWDVVPTPSFQQGANGIYNVAATGPVGYTVGGVYDTAPNGNPLPANMSLSAAGMLQDNGAQVGVTSGVIFSYAEPGALPVLTLHPNVTGTLPYHVGVFPNEGVVPPGYSLRSNNDVNLRGITLSTWPDGSARVMIVAGKTAVTSGVQKTINLRVGAIDDLPTLTVAKIVGVMSSVVLNFGAGIQTLNNFSSPDWVWWANSQVICARYRMGTGFGVMEAIIDIQCFEDGRAFVEVVIENGKVTPSSPTLPASQTYTGATVTVNGSTIATVSTSNAPYAVHQAFRSWYCSTWVGGDPQITVTHDTASMQAHPLFFKPLKPADSTFITPYASDVYTPWSLVRQGNNVAEAGYQEYIGQLTLWDAKYIQSGSPIMARASYTNALGALVYPNSQRSSVRNKVITITDLTGRGEEAGNWPATPGFPYWEPAHQPAVGLVAFMVKPSPVMIEQALKQAIRSRSVSNYPTVAWGGSIYQTRARAWAMRAMSHYMFLLPATSEWDVERNSMQSYFADCLTNTESDYSQNPANKLNYVWDGHATYVGEPSAWNYGAGAQGPHWEHHWFAAEAHRFDKAKVLTGTVATRLSALADWACLQPIRWVNESYQGQWRMMGYAITFSRATPEQVGVGVDMPNTWGEMQQWDLANNPGAVASFATDGPLRDIGNTFSWSDVHTGDYRWTYDAHWWNAFSVAVERDVPGATTAWTRVMAAMTDFAQWSAIGAEDSRWPYPRNRA